MHPELDGDVVFPRISKAEKATGCIPLNLITTSETIQQARPAYGLIKACGHSIRGTPSGFVNYVVISLGHQIIIITDMYIKNGR